MKLEESASPQMNGSRATPMVFVVDDDTSVRESLELLIECAGWQPLLFATAQEFLSHPRGFAPACLVLDVALPGISGLDLQGLLANRPEVPIVFITAYGNVPMTVRAMKAGAIEFLTKPFRDEALLNAVREAIDRSHAVLCREAEIQKLREHYALLSRREREVMALVISGLMNKQIGRELQISEITVKAHRGKVMQKMAADSLCHLINMASKLRSMSSADF
jgi:FixJ family two-component response regulator